MRFDPISTVVTPAASYDLISLENLKADLGIATDTDDAFLTRAIGKASAVIAGYCGWPLVAETIQDEFAYSYSLSPLWLSRSPVRSIASVTANGVTIAAEDYSIDGGRLAPISGSWSAPITVVYEAGYDPVPLDLQMVAAENVKAMQFSRTRDPMLKSENILSGLYAYTLFDPSAGGMPPQIQGILDRYRRVVL